MEFLDKTGVSTLWNKIKDYVGTETKKYLPLSGGTMTGDIARQTPNGTTLYSLRTNGNVAMNQGTGWITCINIDYAKAILSGDGLSISRLGTKSDTEPNYIRYSFDNIHIGIDPSGVRHRYKFNIQKLIDDGYLIEE